MSPTHLTAGANALLTQNLGGPSTSCRQTQNGTPSNTRSSGRGGAIP
jgi:hypothetical protein